VASGSGRQVPVVDMNVSLPPAFAWRTDNKSPLLAGFVVSVQRILDVRAVSKLGAKRCRADAGDAVRVLKDPPRDIGSGSRRVGYRRCSEPRRAREEPIYLSASGAPGLDGIMASVATRRRSKYPPGPSEAFALCNLGA
jgi:hypothetical protein